MSRQAYSLDQNKPLGRQSAGAGFLEAYLRYCGQQRHQIVVAQKEDGPWFHREALRHYPNAESVVHSLNRWGDAGVTAGAIHLPGPGLDEWAWKRMPWGDGAFSLVGIVHTLCSRQVQWGLGQFTTAPVRPWDALVCTSHAARTVVKGFLERQESWLQKRLGADHFERPMLPVIPLGVHAEMWRPKQGRQAERKLARQKLKIDPKAAVILIAGRLDILTKFNPTSLLRILAELQSNDHPNLELLIYGEAPNSTMRDIWSEGVKQLAPHLQVHWVDGKKIDLAGPVRWAADIFVSLADNPQETFGITPLEAMASGLPCVVSDWDGYRDTVIQPGESATPNGFRIHTCMIDGLGKEESEGLLSETMPYDLAVGRLAQGIAVNTIELREKIHQLLSNPCLRQSMGEAGKSRVHNLYRWEVVIQQWSELLEELQARRLWAWERAETSEAGLLPPWLPNCSTGFGAFASEVLHRNWSPTQPHSPNIEQSLHQGVMQSWDQELLKNDNARRKGWWIKHGITNF